MTEQTSTSSDDRASYLLGYGGRWPDVRWPNGARVALSIAVNFEEGAHSSVLDGQSTGETMGECSSPAVLAGRVDLAIEQTFAYGSRAGVWRILETLGHFGVKSTFWVCGRAAERSPLLAKAVMDGGHECASHNYRWVSPAMFDSEQEEEAEIQRSRDALIKAGCGAPLGFYGRYAPTLFTRRILQRLGFLYDSNAYDDDLPYYDYTLPDGPMLVVPYALDTNDWKFHPDDPWGTPTAFLEYLQCALDTLLEEGQRGLPRILNVGLHLRIIGRPARLWALRKFLAYVQTLGKDVWVARRIDIARHWLTVAPPKLDGVAAGPTSP